jgi:hypothetical protein
MTADGAARAERRFGAERTWFRPHRDDWGPPQPREMRCHACGAVGLTVLLPRESMRLCHACLADRDAARALADKLQTT